MPEHIELKLFFLKEKTKEANKSFPRLHIWSCRITSDWRDPSYGDTDESFWLSGKYINLSDDEYWDAFVKSTTEQLMKYCHEKNIMIGRMNNRVLVFRVFLDDAEDAFFKMVNNGDEAGVKISFELNEQK